MRYLTQLFNSVNIPYISFAAANFFNILIGTLIILVLTGFLFVPIKLWLIFFSNKNKSLILKKRISYLWLICVAILTVYSIYEAYSIRVKKIEICQPRFPMKQVKILQISDWHIKSYSSDFRIKKIIRTIKSLEPDIIVYTGDNFNSSKIEKNEVLQQLKTLAVPLGSFWISGNHDRNINKSKLNSFLNNLDITFLDNSLSYLNDSLCIIGVRDPGWKNNKKEEIQENKLFSTIPEHVYKIFLKHKPIVFDTIKEKFDLMLSGHTHNGQIFPGIILVKFVNSFSSGLYRLSKKNYIYVSSGIGTWGPPMRLFSPPDITLITLKNQ